VTTTIKTTINTSTERAPGTAARPVPHAWQHAAAGVGETTVVESAARAARAGRRLVFLDEELRPREIPLADLVAEAERRARGLVGRYGVAPGDRVCVFGPTTPALIGTLLAIWRAGAISVVLPIPRRLDATTLARDLRNRVSAAHSRLVLTSPGTAALLQAELAGVTVAEHDWVDDVPGVTLPPEPDPFDIGLLQFTSGTTSTARAVAVRHGQMVGNPRQVIEQVGVVPGQVVVSWLPLYHDMGVMSMVGSIGAGLDLYLMGTETFIRRPAAWLHALSTYRAALTVAPNFAYGLAAMHLELNASALDLSGLRCAVNGAEAVDRATLQRFVAAAGRHGAPSTSMCPMYGLAEATLAVSVTQPSTPARFLRVDRDALADGRVRPVPDDTAGRDLACCGAPLSGSAVVITDEDGRDLGADAVGEVRVSGPGVVGRYWTADGSPHPQPMCDGDGRLMTGDLGFVHDGELYPCGRLKDMVIVGGRNLYPEDYELLAEQVPGVRFGNVMAFALAGTERMVVVAETRTKGPEAEAVGRQLMDTLRRELSHAPHEAVLVRPGSLPKTSSGKRRRQRCRADYEQGRLDIRAVVR
jgi:fatty-acyl-CoA synthase